MLIDINIKNFGLIQNTEINLKSGLCIITGASGSGKSVFIEAIAFALGHTSGRKYQNDSSIEVSLVFELDTCSELKNWFEENSLDWEETCTVRRVIQPGKNAKSYVNGSVISLTNLKKLSPYLISIHGQHSNLQLLNTEYQHQCLDLYGKTEDLAKKVQQCHHTLNQLHKNLQEWENNKELRSEQINWLEYQIKELKQMNPQPNECSDLESERKRLSLVEECSTYCHTIFDHLAPLTSKPLHSHLANLCEHFPELKNTYQLLESIELQAKECDYELNRIIPTLGNNTERQHFVDQRLSEFYQLSRKHKCDVDELNETLSHLESQFDKLYHHHENNELQEQISLQQKKYEELSSELSKKRTHFAKKLEKIINQSLHKIGLNEGKFSIQLDNFTSPNSKGNEQASFWIQTNPGQPHQPIQSMSGGEMSRLHLLMQSILPSSLPRCVIFDEIDVGISGSIAAIIGELLYEIADQYQALCITHLAQVACQGKQHLHVTKAQNKTSTKMTVTSLNAENRIEVIAGLLSARDITEATRVQAKHLLKQSNPTTFA